ncbi:plasmid pRiA4b ORF-3 family protein, partial [uncultured Paenibacillus sp.]|uniref:plasmid pRiA4b ORF-3 family protein n=1 Tax=uncultured Paenibacillus sp. TaxID=227322 RepID=UPI0037DD4CF3
KQDLSTGLSYPHSEFMLKTSAWETFQSLNPFEKYVYMLQTYWTRYDFNGKFSRWISISAFYNLLATVAGVEAQQRVMKDQGFIDLLYSEGADFLHHLSFFGWGELEQIEGARGKYEDSILAFLPNEFGIEACRYLLSKALPYWNRNDLPFLLSALEIKAFKEKDEHPFEVFRNLFPEGYINETVEEPEMTHAGVYTFKVKLSKSVWRKIELSHNHSLYDLHIAIQDAFDFGNDHLYAFYIGGSERTGNPIYCPEAAEGKADTLFVKVSDVSLYIGASMLYLFDFGDEWRFDVELVHIEEDAPLPLKPTIVESKGEAPEQYPLWD